MWAQNALPLRDPDPQPILTHWGRVTHICVVKLNIVGSDNGLSPGRRQAIIWTNAVILLIGPLGTNFSEIVIENHTFSFKKMHLKMSFGKCRPCCLGLNVLRAVSHIRVNNVSDITDSPTATRASIHWAVRRLTAKSRKFSKPRDWMLQWSYRSEIWQAPRQQRCRGTCQILERLEKFKPESRGFETSRDLAVRRFTA